MGSIPDDKIEEILERIDLVDLVSRYVTLKRVGKNYFGLCPFHSEKTPSFSVSPEKQLYYCFGCGARGNAITFLMQIEGLSFIEAVRELADQAGVELTFSRRERENELKRATLQNVLKVAEKFFQDNLRTAAGEKARDYLRKRGLTEEVIREWGIGYASPGWRDLREYLRKQKISDELAEKAGLIIAGRDSYYDRFRDRIIFPIYDQRNRIVGFGGRIITESSDSPKYLNSPETPLFNKSKTLFGLNKAASEISRTGEVFLVEGYLDVISLWQNGVKNSVAPLGTGLTEDQIKILSRLAGRVYITFDSDNAGVKATLRAIELLTVEGVEHFVMRLPEGEDPDSFIRKEGIEGWKSVRDKALHGFDFYLGYHLHRYGKTPEGVAKCAGIVAELIGKVKDPVLRELYIARASEFLGISEESLKVKVKLEKGSSSSPEKVEKWNFYPEEEMFVALFLKNPSLVEESELRDAGRYLISPILRDLLEKWFTLVKSGKDSPGYLVSSDNERMPEIVSYLLSKEFAATEELIGDLIEGMKRRKIKLMQEKLSREIQQAERMGDHRKAKELLKKKQQILNDLRAGVWSGGEL